VIREEDRNRYFVRLDGKVNTDGLQRRFRFTRSEIVRPGGSRTVLITGKAVAGLAAAVDGGSPRLHAGLHDVLLTQVAEDSDIFFEIRGGTNAWPHFDFPAMETRYFVAP
jgi:hypothetical protein